MAFSIGRAGKTLLLNDPSMWAEQNGQITVTVISTLSPTTDAQRLRDQLLGYQDNWDESIVPVIVDSEPRLTGYYEVIGVQCDTDLVAIAKGTFTAYVSLRRVMGYAQPLLESILTGALLTNAVGAVGADVENFHATPATATDYPPIVGTTLATRGSADGTLNFYWAAGIGSISGSPRFGLAPANFYVGAATFEQGSSLQPVVGFSLVQADVVNWRLSNGLVRVTPNASAGKLDVSHHNGSTWSAVKTYVVKEGAGGAALFTGWTALSVLRNSVEEVSIRLGVSTTAPFGPEQVTLDISLRRGDRLARLYMTTSDTVNGHNWTLARNTLEAATAITYGAVTKGAIRATANDGDTNRYVIVTCQRSNPVNDLVNGAISQSANFSTADFGIGSEIGGSGAAAPSQAVDIAKQYLAAQSESQRVVAR